MSLHTRGTAKASLVCLTSEKRKWQRYEITRIEFVPRSPVGLLGTFGVATFKKSKAHFLELNELYIFMNTD